MRVSVWLTGLTTNGTVSTDSKAPSVSSVKSVVSLVRQLRCTILCLAIACAPLHHTHAASILAAGDEDLVATLPPTTNAPTTNPPPEATLDTILDSAFASSAITGAVPPAAQEKTLADTDARDSKIDALVDTIRDSYEKSIPRDRLDEAKEEQFLEDVRRHLESSQLSPPPSTNPDDYRQRQHKEILLTGERNAVIMGGDEGSLSLAEHGDETIYTYRDQAGNVIYEGPVESREDREKIPFDVWKLYYEMERDRMESRKQSDSEP